MDRLTKARPGAPAPFCVQHPSLCGSTTEGALQANPASGGNPRSGLHCSEASLLDARSQYKAEFASGPGALQQAHFIRMSNARQDTAVLLANIYQFQASQQEGRRACWSSAERQAAMRRHAAMLCRVVTKWSDHTADGWRLQCQLDATCWICLVGDDSERLRPLL